jgi:hypothetical protein
MTIQRIFLDLDGVLADWTSAAIVSCGRDPAEVYSAWPQGGYDLAVALGISSSAMWSAVHRGGADFWADLEPYPWMGELVALCRRTAPTTILTSPSSDPLSLAGKLVWLQRHLGHDFRSFLVGPDKASCARFGAVLIDDREGGCNEFVRAGGQAIVFPRIWNRNAWCTDPIGFVRDALADHR